MRKLIVLFSLTALIIPVATYAQWNNWSDTAYPYSATIDSLPYTVDQDSTLYTISNNLFSSANGIYINTVSYSKIKGNGDTITFDGSGDGGAYGMYMRWSDHVVIEDLTIMQAATTGHEYGNTGGPNVIGFILGPNNYVLIKNCNVHVRGHSSICFDGAYGDPPFNAWAEGIKTEIEIDGGNYTSFTQSFDSRMANDAAVMKLDCKPFVAPEQYNFYVHNVVVDSACHVGIGASDVAWFEYNNVTIDAHNEKPGVSWANAHAISGGALAAGSRFRYNTVRTGNNHYGGRGMYFDYCVGTAAAPIEISNNDIRVSSGYTTESSAARGMRVRWGCFYLRIHHNYIEVYADDDPATQQISDEAHGIWFTAVGEEGSALGAYNEIYNNTIKVVWTGNASAKPTHVGALFVEQVRDPSRPFGNGSRSYHNRFISNLHPILLGEVNGGSEEWTSYQDTIEWALPHMTDGYNNSGAVTVGYYNGPSDNNRIIDPVFINGTKDDVVQGGNYGSCYVMRSLELAVEGMDDLPVTNASVHIWPRQAMADSSNLSAAVVAKTTGTGGLILDTLPYFYKRWSGGSLVAESTYNDYRIRAAKETDVTWTRMTLADPNYDQGEWGPFQDTLTLPNTAGDTTWPSDEANLWVDGSTQVEGGNLMFIVHADLTVTQNVTYNFATQNGSAQAPGDFIAESGTGTILAGQTADTIFVTTVDDTVVEETETMSFVISNPSSGTISTGTAIGTITDNDSAADNTPPTAPGLNSPAAGAEITDPTPTLVVNNGYDADGDALTYHFELYNSTGTVLLDSQSGIIEGVAITSWTVPNELQPNTTYRWRARCYDGTEYSPWMSMAQFTVTAPAANQPPTAPGLNSPSAGAIITDPTPTLVVNNGTDADGDALTYHFELYNSTGTVLLDSLSGIIEGVAITSWAVPNELQPNTTYRWRARCYDGTDYSSWMSMAQFTVTAPAANQPPTAPSLNSPAAGAEITDLTPTLVVNNGTDADGDALTYHFELYDSTGTVLLDSLSGITEGATTTSWTVPNALPANTTYRWRARCYDGIDYSPWMSMARFTVTAPAANQPPSAPTLHSPAQGSVVNEASPTLSVTNGSDPDGDTLTYAFELYDSAGVSLIASANGVFEGVQYTTWPVPIELDDNTTYSWRARCFDGVEYSPWMSLARFQVDVSAPLGLPVHVSPSDGEIIVGGPIALTVNNSTHAPGLQVTYDFLIYSNFSLTELVEEQRDIPETPDQTSALFSFEPIHEQTYWWQVRASDGTNTTELTAATSFTFYTFGLSDSTVPQAAQPGDGGVVHTTRPVLSALNITEAGDHDYYFQVASDSDFTDIVESSEPVAEGFGDTTSWQLNNQLESNRTYYWHVRADNYAYSDASNFTVVPQIIAYPNPVHFLRGETVTFQLPDEPVDLLIQTVAGETVLIKENLSGEWEWDGKNASGFTVAIGTYSWFISNSGQNGKIVVLP